MSTVSEDGTLQATYTYDASGNRASLTYANGVVESYQYNKANWITGLTNKKDNTTLSSYTYTYYASGSQKSETTNTGVVTGYTYDDLGRLTRESETNGLTLAYTYDANGNRTQMTASGTDSYTTAYTYDANNRLTTEAKTQSGTTTTSVFTYDDNGNLLTELDATNTAVVTHSYDGFNRLISSVVGTTTTITYTYNAQGIRTSRQAGDTYTQYLLDGGNVMGEVTDGTVTTYLRGANLISNGDSYYLYNAHGDVVQLTNASGTVTKSYDYDAFGNEKNPSDTDTNPFRYCGEYYDTETGLYYLRARYYDPTVGRFTQEDTHWNTANMIYGDNPQKINEREDALGLKTYSYAPQISAIVQSGNLYVYCGNDPIGRIDPTGNEWYHWVLGGLIVAAAAAAVVVTAGGALPALYAIGVAASGIALGGVGTTIAAGAFIGGATALGFSAFIAASDSHSFADFGGRGNWSVVASTSICAGLGGLFGYAVNRSASNNSSKIEVSIDEKQLQQKFKHASDYGITGSWNSTNKIAYEQAIRNQINSVANPIRGTYRGNIPVYHFYNSKTGLNTMIDLNGNFISGWKLSPEQIASLLRNGNIQ